MPGDSSGDDWGGDDEVAEDDGVLDPSDSLSTDRLDADVLDVGVDAGTHYYGATAYGTTHDEASRGEPLDLRLAEEEPDAGPDLPWTDEDEPSDDDNVGLPRSGRLVATGDGSLDDAEADLIARDVGIDGGAASAEEAAVHLTDPPRYS